MFTKKYLLYNNLCTNYSEIMKKRDLEKKLSLYGWYFYRHGGGHDVWTNGNIFESVPRHKEVNELLAKKILKKAMDNPIVEEKE